MPTAYGNSLVATDCAGKTCFAVGQAIFGGRGKTLIERSTASGWVIVPSPNRASARFNGLLGISCPAVKLCFAVGNSIDTTLIERWNGSKWSIVPSPDDPKYTTRLTAVSCASANNCVAVGEYQAELIGTFIVHWNGSKWSIVPSPSRVVNPNFSTPGINELVGVSCTSAVNCFAVGYDRDQPFQVMETLIEHWDGTKWALVPSPKGPFRFSRLTGVSCLSAKSCYAVGSSFSDNESNPKEKTLIVQWNGTKWTRVASPNRSSARRSSLAGVACTTKTSCVAVGFASNTKGDTFSPLIERLSGAKWSIVPSPNRAGATSVSLSGVDCVNATVCTAVGSGSARAGPVYSLVEHSS